MFRRSASFLAQYRFPLALALVFLLALPGMVLLAVSLFGGENAVNGWLQERYSLSYGVNLPWYASLLLLLLPFLLLLLYFLKLKRKPLAVPSTFLWRKSIEDLHVNSLLQWLRQNVLLLLQLLVVFVLIYGALNLRTHSRRGHGKHYIIMIDNSASMSATDVKPSRLEGAKAEALKEINAAGDDDFGMVIEFNSAARPVQARTGDRELLRQAVRSIKPTQRTTNITEALRLAESLANRLHSAENESSRPEDEGPGVERKYAETQGTPTEVHIYSDGRFPAVEDFRPGNLKPLHFHAAGLPGPENVRNVAVVDCSASRDDRDPRKVRVFAGLKNYCPFDVKARVKLELYADGRRDPERDRPFEQIVTLPKRVVTAKKSPDGEKDVVTDEPGEKGVAFELDDLGAAVETEAHVKLTELRDAEGRPVEDHFALDDRAWLVVGVVRKARVLVVGKDNPVLRAFFEKNEGTKAVARVDFLAPDDLAGEKYLTPALNGAYDLVIFDRCGPAKKADMPRANTFFLGHAPPKSDGEGDEKYAVEPLRQPHVVGWMSSHSLLKGLAALDLIAINEGFKVKDLPPRTPHLMDAGNDTALMFTLTRGAFTDLVMTFPLFTADGKWNTDWTIHHTSWPIFLANVLFSLGNVGDGIGEDVTRPGQVKALRPDAAVDEIRVTPPGGTERVLKRGGRPDFDWADTEQVGVYRAAWPGGGSRFAVNLLDADESNLEPRAALQLGGEEVKSQPNPGQPHELWRWVVLAALALLLLEWYVYNRRVAI